MKTMSKIEDCTIDLIVTSPPYNKGFYADKNAKVCKDVWGSLAGRKIAYENYDDCMNPTDYERWQKNVLLECMRILKPSGSIFYNHKDIIYKGLIVPPKWVYDFPVHQQIIWDRKSSCMIDKRYFMPANEWIYWIVKDPKQTFFVKENTVFRTNIWQMNAESNPHPAPFPLRFAKNAISCCCPKEGIVYDPFNGSGTTSLAAMQLGMSYIGSEISSTYVDMAKKRLHNESLQLNIF